MDAGDRAEAPTIASLSGTIPFKASVFLFIALFYLFCPYDTINRQQMQGRKQQFCSSIPYSPACVMI
jgi:hypothetical protein